jgi:hypothetical protein
VNVVLNRQNEMILHDIFSRNTESFALKVG